LGIELLPEVSAKMPAFIDATKDLEFIMRGLMKLLVAAEQ
jgi:hypothetical protein